jgi:hypothetical protein
VGRIRCLEAVVKGAFPNDDIATAEDVLRLGRRMGYHMPDLTDESRPFLKLEDMVRLASSAEAVDQGEQSHTAPPHTQSQRNPASMPPRTRASSEDPQLSLVRDTAGHEHYIGPSGTLSFLGQLRKLVDQNTSSVQATDSEGVNKFVQDDTVQALEADEDYERGSDENTTNAADSAGPDKASPGSITSAIARDFTRLPSADMEEILNQFPQDETLDHLVSSYFKNVHDDFPLFHRATFEEEYELFITRARRWQSRGNTRNRPLPDWGWIGCLHMIIVFGSIAQPKIPGIDHAALRRRCVTAARVLLPQFVAKCTLTNVRVLLLLSLFLHNNNERNAAWNLVGTATRICFALGLHRTDMGASFRPIERETRKRVFCTLYSFEQFLAASLGRPSGVQEIEVEAVPPREGFLDGGGSTDSKLMSMALRLQSILSRTRLIYLDKRRRSDAVPGVEIPTTEAILIALKQWKEEISHLPGFDIPWIKLGDGEGQELEGISLDHLKDSLEWRTRTQLRAVVLLHIQYHYIALTATRPLLLRDVASVKGSSAASVTTPTELSTTAQLCVKHACQLGYLVLLLDSFEVINGLWGLDIFYAYCAAMVLILRLLRRKSLESVSGSGAVIEAANEEACRGLMVKIQDVMTRTDKGGSMRRFCQVVETFSRCIDKPGSRLVERTAGQSYPSGVEPPLQHPMLVDGMLTASVPTNPTPLQPYSQGSSEHMMGFLPLSTFGSTVDYNGQSLGNDDFALPEWSDMEMFFGGYGVQG